jgi:sirohydrochlorin cobaltochelatase
MSSALLKEQYSDKKIGVLVCGHGSRSKTAVAEFSNVAIQLKSRFSEWPVEYGYLEFADPVIRDGLDRLCEHGINHVLAIPGMLFAAAHVKNDIPATLKSYAAERNITVEYGRDLAVDPSLLQAAAERIQCAVTNANNQHGTIPLHETCLVVIGRGASDPDANSNVSKVARMLWEGMGFGWCEVGYSGVTFPLVEPCLRNAAKLGFRRIVVFPYFLFTGVLVDRIYGFVQETAKDYPDIQFISAQYLNDHPNVIDAFVSRIYEILESKNEMNCLLCKYRSPIPGFENEQGMAQQSHHHHSEGESAAVVGSFVENCALCDSFCTGACRLPKDILRKYGYDTPESQGTLPSSDLSDHHHPHAHDHEHTHDHAHPEYPHARHPLGPLSVEKWIKVKNDKN